MISCLAATDPTSHILPHDLFRIGSWVVTNQMLMALVAAVLMLLIFPVLFSRARDDAPSGSRNFFESIMEFLRVEVFRPALKEHTDRFVPFLWTLFFFILFCNLLGMIPFGSLFGLIGVAAGKPHLAERLGEFGGTATGNVNTTGVLALCALAMIHLSGIAQIARDLIRGTYGHHGHHEEAGTEAAGDLEHARSEALPAATMQPVGHGHGAAVAAQAHGQGMNPLLAIVLATPLYLWNFAPHPFRPGPGDSWTGWIMDVPLWVMLLVLELVGAVIKPFALMIRLFANMIAGHLVLGVLIGFIVVAPGILTQIGIAVPVTVLSLLILVLELFVAFLQAYIFTFLTTLFIASAVAPEH
jgi:F0F1-type ATP synthase membrane subunit a